MNLLDTIHRALNDETMTEDEIGTLFQTPLFSYESGLILAAAREKSHVASDGMAEIIGIAPTCVGPTRCFCSICSFAQRRGLFAQPHEFSADDVISQAREFIDGGANSIMLINFAEGPFESFVEIGAAAREKLGPDPVLIADFGDMSAEQAKGMKDAGFNAIFHSVRIGEGETTPYDPDKRIESIRHAREAGLKIGTAVEAVGNEQGIEDLVDKTLTARELQPDFCGAGRRYPVPGTDLERFGLVSEAKMAMILGVVRLAMPRATKGMLSHGPNTLGAAAGGNLFIAETAPPQGLIEAGGGVSAQECRRMFSEAEWRALDGPSKIVGESDNS